MMALTKISQALMTMSSREIADLTGKEHRHVLRDIEVMLRELDLGVWAAEPSLGDEPWHEAC